MGSPLICRTNLCHREKNGIIKVNEGTRSKGSMGKANVVGISRPPLLQGHGPASRPMPPLHSVLVREAIFDAWFHDF
jgi:hypothetical protein